MTEQQAVAATAICVFIQVVMVGDFHCDDEQHRALMFFFDAYMNTGCDEGEAADMTRSTFIRCAGNVDRIYFEAEPYRDM